MKSECARLQFEVEQERRLPIDTALCVRYLLLFASCAPIPAKLGEKGRIFGVYSAYKGRYRQASLTEKHKGRLCKERRLQPCVLAPTREPVRTANSVSPVRARLTNCLGVSSVGSCERN